MTVQEFNNLPIGERLKLIGARNEIYTKVLFGGKRIDTLHKLGDNFYVQYRNSPEEEMFIIYAFDKDDDWFQFWTAWLEVDLEKL